MSVKAEIRDVYGDDPQAVLGTVTLNNSGAAVLKTDNVNVRDWLATLTVVKPGEPGTILTPKDGAKYIAALDQFRGVTVNGSA